MLVVHGGANLSRLCPLQHTAAVLILVGMRRGGRTAGHSSPHALLLSEGYVLLFLIGCIAETALIGLGVIQIGQ